MSGGGAYVCKSQKPKERRRQGLSVYETLTLMIAFGTLIVAIMNNKNKKKNRPTL
ncbi:putative holin-like toxin [Streptococcus pyogenes]|uniref:putative holin-like toxin n=1 Tax=Streptococcus pyogenes TaxID=1314 RepID=UPI00109D39B1|nr:putative holin-like toxin [Streptococcus pyogenes]